MWGAFRLQCQLVSSSWMRKTGRPAAPVDRVRDGDRASPAGLLLAMMMLRELK